MLIATLALLAGPAQDPSPRVDPVRAWVRLVEAVDSGAGPMRLCVLPDLDGDEVAEFASGAPVTGLAMLADGTLHNGPANHRHAGVEVRSGASGERISRHDGGPDRPLFGAALAWIPARGEEPGALAIGAPSVGEVHILAEDREHVIRCASGVGESELFGASLLAVGEDLVIGAPLAPGGGRVDIVSFATGARLRTLQLPDDMTGRESLRLGTSLVATPDRDGDGDPDLLVGAPARFDGVGGLAVWYGSREGQVLAVLRPKEPRGRFGGSVAVHGAGDDLRLVVGISSGVHEALPGACVFGATGELLHDIGLDQDNGYGRSARVRVLPGLDEGTGPRLAFALPSGIIAHGPSGGVIVTDLDGTPVESLGFQSAGFEIPVWWFGQDVVSLGDADGDGFIDLVVCASSAGGTALLSGDEWDPIWTRQ